MLNKKRVNGFSRPLSRDQVSGAATLIALAAVSFAWLLCLDLSQLVVEWKLMMR